MPPRRGGICRRLDLRFVLNSLDLRFAPSARLRFARNLLVLPGIDSGWKFAVDPLLPGRVEFVEFGHAEAAHHVDRRILEGHVAHEGLGDLELCQRLLAPLQPPPLFGHLCGGGEAYLSSIRRHDHFTPTRDIKRRVRALSVVRCATHHHSFVLALGARACRTMHGLHVSVIKRGTHTKTSSRGGGHARPTWAPRSREPNSP